MPDVAEFEEGKWGTQKNKAAKWGFEAKIGLYFPPPPLPHFGIRTSAFADFKVLFLAP